MKNISQLEFIKNNTENIETKLMCDEKILYLREIIKKYKLCIKMFNKIILWY